MMRDRADQLDQVRGRVLAVDPGRDKCGLAVMESDRRVLYHAVVPTGDVAQAAARLVEEYQVNRLAVGDRTAAQRVCRALASAGLPLKPVLVDEHRSSEQGRRRYFRDNPPRGWRRLVPVTMQTPSRPYDDYVAIVLAERYLAARGGR
jgi:hypothetical protein